MEIKKGNKNKMYIPFLVALPSITIGFLANMNSNIMPLLVEKVTSSTLELSYIMMISSVASLIAPYISGMISDRLHTKIGRRKPILIFATITGCIGLYLLGTSNSYLELIIFSIIVYFSINFYQGSYYAWMPEAVEPNQIGTVNGLSKFFYSLSGIVIFGVGVVLFDMNQQFPFYLMIIAFIIFTLIASLTVKDKNIIEESNEKKVKEKLNFFDILKNKNALVLFIGSFFVIFNMGLLMAYWIPYFEKSKRFFKW